MNYFNSKLKKVKLWQFLFVSESCWLCFSITQSDLHGVFITMIFIVIFVPLTAFIEIQFLNRKNVKLEKV